MEPGFRPAVERLSEMEIARLILVEASWKNVSMQ
jgi:hypothetical protein